MNLADYLSELLEQQDEVSVPHLGCFVRIHVNGYYDDTEARFHPPYHQVKFTPIPKDDDIFTAYVAEKKNISLASSKYFAEKFVAGLNEQAAKSNFLFSDLGLFRNEQGRLVFKPNERITPDPSFYGFPIVSLHKIGAEQSNLVDEPKAFTEDAAQVEASAATVNSEYYEDELAAKKPVSIGLIILIAAGIMALAAFGIYRLYPGAFNKVGASYRNIAGGESQTPKPAPKVVKHDTLARLPVADTDTISKIVAPPVDTIPADRFEIIIGSARDLKKANILIAGFARRGVTAKIVTDAPGKRLKISAGTFTDKVAAENERLELARTRKIIKANSYTLEIKPSK